jgi:hypothetical protein
VKLLSEQNQMKDMWMDEIMEKIYETRKEMNFEVEQYTKVCLQLEVQKF